MSANPSANWGPIRVLSVDDHPLLREAVAALLASQSDITLVAEAPTATRRSNNSENIVLTSP